MGYQNDTPATIVFQATHSMSVLQQQLKDKVVAGHLILDLVHISSEVFCTETEGSDTWLQAVSA